MGWRHQVVSLVLFDPDHFLICNARSNLDWAAADFAISDEVLFSFIIVQHNFDGLPAKRTLDGCGRHGVGWQQHELQFPAMGEILFERPKSQRLGVFGKQAVLQKDRWRPRAALGHAP